MFVAASPIHHGSYSWNFPPSEEAKVSQPLPSDRFEDNVAMGMQH